MEKRKIIWRRAALIFLEEYLEWYRDNMGIKTAQKFFDGVSASIDRLRIRLGIGRYEYDYTKSGLTLRSFLMYKHYRILYGYNDTELVIIGFWDVRRVVK